ncbi:MAG: nitronate monooxygenase [Anaerolineae bacterium]|nr:nitronate monooxygenase [Anaerolineae bacterium]
MALPRIIQGGMGVAVSSWQLANAVSREGQLGVISGTGIGLILISRLMDGDEGGHVRRALAAFPMQSVAQRILDKYYVEGGREPGTPYKRATLWTTTPTQALNELTVAANFVEVWLAKEGHNNPVGINLLEKVQLPNLSSLYGAMLAGVDYVIMGAGIPMQIPGALDAFAKHQPFSYRLDVHGADQEDDIRVWFKPEEVFPGITELVGDLKRPMFLPIVSSVVLALALRKRANGEINGFVIEMPTAGGHNAPPRVDALNDDGEPIYGPKDEVDLSKFRKMGLPFWLAGGYGSAEKFQEALAEGAQGIQVGTAFAFCDESGFDLKLRRQVLEAVQNGSVRVRTDPVASPTGFPFKVVQMRGTVAEPTVYEERPRICDVGYLRTIYKREDGKVDFRCPAEPVDAYVRKGGTEEDTYGRVCLCNQLGSAAGFHQLRKGEYEEPAIITSGDDLPNITQFIPEGQDHYSVKDVLTELTSLVTEPVAE